MQRTRGKDTVDVQTTQAPDGRIQRIGGLTKREYFAIECLAGMCSAGTHHDVPAGTMKVQEAVKLADVLIDELNRTNNDDA